MRYIIGVLLFIIPFFGNAQEVGMFSHSGDTMLIPYQDVIKLYELADGTSQMTTKDRNDRILLDDKFDSLIVKAKYNLLTFKPINSSRRVATSPFNIRMVGQYRDTSAYIVLRQPDRQRFLVEESVHHIDSVLDIIVEIGDQIDTSISGKVNYTDTAAMLEPYITEVEVNDTLSYYYLSSQVDSADALRLLYTDTAAMLEPYITELEINDTLSNYYTQSQIDSADALRLLYTDTAAMLSFYADRKELQDTASDLRTLIGSKADTSDLPIDKATGNIAYVSTNGDNGTAEIGNPLKPFADILSAIDSVQSTSDTTNVTIYIYAGDYTVDGTGRQVNLTPFDTTNFIHEGGIITLDNFDDTAEGFGDFINTSRDVRNACLANIILPYTSIIINPTGGAQIPIYYGHLNSDITLDIGSIIQTATTSFRSRIARIAAKNYKANFGFVRAQEGLHEALRPKTSDGDTLGKNVSHMIMCDRFEAFSSSGAIIQFADATQSVESSEVTVDIIDLIFEDNAGNGGVGGIYNISSQVAGDTLNDLNLNINIDNIIGSVSRTSLTIFRGDMTIYDSHVQFKTNNWKSSKTVSQVIEFIENTNISDSDIDFDLGLSNLSSHNAILTTDATVTSDSLTLFMISGTIILDETSTDTAITSQADLSQNNVLKELMVSGNSSTNFLSSHTYKVLSGVFTNMSNNAGDTEEIGTIIYDANVGDIR